VLSMATEQASWFGFSGDPTSSVMANLPNNLDWYPLIYMGLSFGNLSVFLALFAMLVCGVIIYRLGSSIESLAHRVLVKSLLFVLMINLLRVILGTYFLALPNGHFGLPFVSAGQMSLFVGLLLFITMCGVPNYVCQKRSNT